MQELRFVWLEITGKCQLACEHCYADSGPKGTDGAMQPTDWRRVIEETARLGGRMVQFIGGEPTLHRSLPELVNHALAAGVEVEVFSNLVHVPSPLWEVFAQPGVRLATSYYSDDAAEHASITKGRGSHARTKANIAEALRRSIPLRVGLIDVQDGQRVDQARAELDALGVTEIGLDRLRQVGRGVRDQKPSLDQLCGNCARGQIAVAADGAVWPCVFSRWMPVGNVRTAPLAEILAGPAMVSTTAQLEEHFGPVMSPRPCDPQCGPNCSPACLPSCWPTGTGPCGPKRGCQPNYDA
ncbi:radical SAM protein [Allokutzneria sp. A3M-2-11 16]|uniref:radical SAM protein n=1 Tax=Allokutzneria sp. A3M-2-11 16 TaxID=2962043 RepID=UPI0020B90274|nr:radical SAM protein [Allokutzneria sp. A3M-2-11 16]MCP3800356.1 radical SAM protein [Allokutzneria sp. A3M-2-11 16]